MNPGSTENRLSLSRLWKEGASVLVGRPSAESASEAGSGEGEGSRGTEGSSADSGIRGD